VNDPVAQMESVADRDEQPQPLDHRWLETACVVFSLNF
jgi:hypothetical protein